MSRVPRGHGKSHRHDLRAIARRAMIERGFAPDFSSAAAAEVDRIVAGHPDHGLGGSAAPATARGAAGGPANGVRDMRDRPWCSIDNDDSQDLDQLSVAEPGGNGATRLFVAVADVDALVREGTAIDEHARRNTTSVYTAAEIFPMLPVELSTDLTSLGQDRERRAIVVEMTVRTDGSLEGSDLYAAVVRNRAKLAYSSVGPWLEGSARPPDRVAADQVLAEQLRIQDRAAQCLRHVRHEHGALTLESIEPRAVFDGDVLTDLRVEEKNRAKELIEDLMIAANGVTARYLRDRGLPTLRRVLRSPERWERIVDVAAGLGTRLPDQPDAAALEQFLAARRLADPMRFPDLSLTIVKLMGRGEYEVGRPREASEGHFGLAVHDYTHSTAPNRRYPDLITQRLLKAALDGEPSPYRDEDLDELARHVTEQEDNANKIERLVAKAAAALLLEGRWGQRFDGIVTGASAKGTWVRILRPPVEGRVVEGFEGLDVGEKVQVELVGTDVERGFIDFAIRSASPSR